MARPNVLIVGGGITGAATYYFLSILLPQAVYKILEKEESIGGRMATDFPLRKIGKNYFCDMGAQYLSSDQTKSCLGSVDSSQLDFESLVYSPLLQENILKALNPHAVMGMRSQQLEMRHLVAPGGLKSVVSRLSNGADIRLGRRLQSLGLTEDKLRWVATSRDSVSEEQECFDIVVLAVPVPELMQIKGCDCKAPLFEHQDLALEEVVGLGAGGVSSIASKLSETKYSSRFALACYFPRQSWDALKQVPWTAAFVPAVDEDGNPSALRYISIESRKAAGGDTGEDGRLAGQDVGPSILLHSSIPFALDLKADTSVSRTEDGWDVESTVTRAVEERVVSTLLRELDRIVPGLGAPQLTTLRHWRCSQVTHSAYSSDEQADVLGGHSVEGGDGLNRRTPILAIAGDMFTESNFEGCLRSARAAATEIARRILAL